MRRDQPYHTLCIILLFFLVTLAEGYGQLNFPAGGSFRFLKGQDAATLGGDWVLPGFDDSGWSTGGAPFWYGDGSGGTWLEDMQYTYSVLYLRTTFQAEGVDSLETVTLSIDYDDGFVIFVNGSIVLSRNAPASLFHNSFATRTMNRECPKLSCWHRRRCTLWKVKIPLLSRA